MKIATSRRRHVTGKKCVPQIRYMAVPVAQWNEGNDSFPRFSERKKKINVHNLLYYRYILFIH